MNSTRRRNIILLIGALVLTAAVILCLRLGLSARKPEFFLDYSSVRSGHLGNVYSKRFTVATLTNITRVPIRFKKPLVEREGTNGIVVSDLAVMWNGKDYTISVLAGDSA